MSNIDMPPSCIVPFRGSRLYETFYVFRIYVFYCKYGDLSDLIQEHDKLREGNEKHGRPRNL